MTNEKNNFFIHLEVTWNARVNTVINITFESGFVLNSFNKKKKHFIAINRPGNDVLKPWQKIRINSHSGVCKLDWVEALLLRIKFLKIDPYI